jgi:hypothetical protein
MMYLIIGIVMIPVIILDHQDEVDVTYDDHMAEALFVRVGAPLDLKLEALRSIYTFNRVVVGNNRPTETNELNPYMYSNHRFESTVLRHGIVNYSLYLYENETFVAQVALGYRIQYELHHPSWHELTSENFVSSLMAMPNGRFYLKEDIDLEDQQVQIPRFSGVIVNPEGFVIRGIKTIDQETTQGLFKVLDEAMIDGLIIEDAMIDVDAFDSGTQSMMIGILASEAYDSIITNTHVQGTITGAKYGTIGGLVGASYGSVYRYVSFEGLISAKGAYIGGLIGFHSGFMIERYPDRDPMITSINVIEHAYVNAELIGSTYGMIGGLISVYDGQTHIKHAYVTGLIERGDAFYGISYVTVGNRFYGTNGDSSYQDIYVDRTLEISGQSGSDGHLVTFVDQNVLTNGEPLAGLERFDFQEGLFPSLEYWGLWV